MTAFQVVGLLMMVGFAVYLFIVQAKKKKPNALVWWHPDHKGGIEWCHIDQDAMHQPWKVDWDYFGLVKRDVWLWFEEKVDEVILPEGTKEVPPEADESFLYCKCGYKVPKDKDKAMKMHLLWSSKKGDRTLFEKTHGITTVPAFRKEVIKGIVETQKQPLIKSMYVLKPYEPRPFEAVKVKSPDEVDNPRVKLKEPITTPNSLWDTTNWQCAVRFGTIPSKIKEAIKLGIGIGMFAICVVALIMIIDMVQKGQKL